MKIKAAVILLLLMTAGAFAQQTSRLNVHLVTDEADAVLAILAKEDSGAKIEDKDWQRVFASEGYQRLKKREAQMKRAFEDQDFQKFVESPELRARRAALEKTLAAWKRADLRRPAELAMAYLPENATIKASVYPVIKPKTNSFVFEVDTNPAIFLYLDPDVDQAEFENTVAHEFHHIGYSSSCPPKENESGLTKQSDRVQQLANWVGAFGEGFAMLAAAGGPEVNAHATGKAADRERWDHDVADFNKNQQEVDSFFRKILSGELTHDQAREQGFSYFGIQGPWYTVGWKMAVTVEHENGRKRLIAATCDFPAFLSVYNNAAKKLAADGGEKLPLWSPEIIKALSFAETK